MNDENIRLVASAVKKYNNGDFITDKELNTAIKELRPIVKLLGSMGPKYHFVEMDLYNKLDSFIGFQEARKSNKGNT